MINVQIINNATPAVRKLLRKYPELVIAARTETVQKHRRILRRHVQRNDQPQKKQLGAPQALRMHKLGVSAKIQNRHIHRSTQAYSGQRSKTLRQHVKFKHVNRDATDFGYLGQAGEWMQMLSDGAVRWHGSRIARKNPVVTDEMREYYKENGIALKNTTKILRTTPRPVVESYFIRNRNRIASDFMKYFVKQLHKKAGELFR